MGTQATARANGARANGSPASEPDHEVVVVGAGLSGLCTAIKLQKAGIEDFVLLERADDIGGCWRDNTYPGIAVDINSFSYSFSFEPNPNWTRTFAPGEELKAYADYLADKYQLRPRIRFNAEVEQAIFDAEQHMWRLRLAGGEALSARFLICGTGVLKDPQWPDIEGLEKFGGKTVHTARWDHDHNLRGKRVAVIGTGASAVQVVPAIAGEVEQLHVYQRTPIWALPRPDYPIPDFVQTMFRRVPLTHKVVRTVSGAVTEAVLLLGVVYNRQLPFLTQRVESFGRRFMKSQVKNPELRDKLAPHYGIGCKRPVAASNYFPTFNRDNVELVTDPIERITKTGIRTADGRLRKIDTLILATGFKVLHKGNIPGFKTIGPEGLALDDYWAENRYQAYEGISVPRFPNFFLLFGPYSLGGSSFLATTETHVRHALRCIGEARRRGATWVEVRQEVHDRYFEEILGRMGNTIFFNNNCETANSYYFDERGDAPGLRPHSGIEMWWRSARFSLDNYQYRTLGDGASRERTGAELAAA